MLCSQMHPLDQIFEFVGEGGVREMFDATALWEYVMRNPGCADYIEDDIEDDWARYIIANRGVEARTIFSMSEGRIEDPILGILRADGTTLMVDGHHRYVRRWRDGLKTYRMIRVKLGQWEWSVVTDFPDEVSLLTQTEKGDREDVR